MQTLSVGYVSLSGKTLMAVKKVGGHTPQTILMLNEDAIIVWHIKKAHASIGAKSTHVNPESHFRFSMYAL